MEYQVVKIVKKPEQVIIIKREQGYIPKQAGPM